MIYLLTTINLRGNIASFAIFVFVILLTSLFVNTPGVQAVQTAPFLLNFQGRLADATGVSLADGTYNIRFRAYLNNPTGGTATWTETHSGANRVTVKNGIFSTQLGGITPFSSSDFTAYDIYIETELPTPATATCDGVGCSPSWTEGAMTPRQIISSNGYAMNADLIDGVDGAALAQLSANQTFTGNNIFTGTFLQQNTSTTAFRIQNAGGTNALLIDTSGLGVKVGGGDVSPDASPTLLVFDYKNTAGDPTGVEGAFYYNSTLAKMRCYEDGVWRDCIGRARTRLEEKDEFMGPYAYTNGAQYHASFVSGSGSGGAITHLAGEASHPGIARATTGNSSTTGAVVFASNYDTLYPVQFGSGTWTFTTELRIVNASTSLQRYTLYSGLMDNTSTVAPANGCFFRYVDNNSNGDRFLGVCRNAGSESGSTCSPLDSNSNAASTVASVGSSAWYDLRVRVNAAANLATFTLNNSTNIYSCTVSTNIPTTNKVTAAAGMLKSVGSTASVVDFDSLEFIGEGLNR